jgi:hypothetical protein
MSKLYDQAKRTIDNERDVLSMQIRDKYDTLEDKAKVERTKVKMLPQIQRETRQVEVDKAIDHIIRIKDRALDDVCKRSDFLKKEVDIKREQAFFQLKQIERDEESQLVLDLQKTMTK